LRSDASYKELYTRSVSLRQNLIKVFENNKVGHLGGASSLTELIACLYFSEMNISRDAILQDKERDYLILSKGHAVLIQYAALVELGVIPREELGRVKTLGGILQGHPDMRRTPGIEANTGSLGQGLSIALGLALGQRLDGKENRVFTVIGDGELAEGQIWEAAMAVVNFNMNNIIAIIDQNGLQATGPTEKRFRIAGIEEKWKAFGWNTICIDGHNIKEILQAFEDVRNVNNRPSVIIAHTVKGKGFSFAEHNPAFHNAAVNPDQLEVVAKDLNELKQVDVNE